MADNKRPQSVSAKKARRNKLWRNVGIVVGAVALVALVLVSYFTSTTYYRQKTAVQIGSHDISVASFNYYYRNAYQNTYNAIQETYGEYASLLIDSSKPLDEQQYSDTQTWQDYLTDTTLANLEEIYAFYDAATAAGFTLDDDAKAEIEDIVASVASAAKQANYKLDNYLAAVYGKGVNEKLYRELLTVVTIATEYSADINEGFTFTDEETAAYYEENRNEIDSVTARVYPIAYETPEDDAGDADAPDNGDAADSGTPLTMATSRITGMPPMATPQTAIPLIMGIPTTGTTEIPPAKGIAPARVTERTTRPTRSPMTRRLRRQTAFTTRSRPSRISSTMSRALSPRSPSRSMRTAAPSSITASPTAPLKYRSLRLAL